MRRAVWGGVLLVALWVGMVCVGRIATGGDRVILEASIRPSYTPYPTPTPTPIPQPTPVVAPAPPPPTRLPVAAAPAPVSIPGNPNIVGLIRQVFGPEADRAIRVAWCESRHNPKARNGSHYGLMQISRRWHEGRARRMGYSWGQMLEPEPNLRVAHAIWREQGWRPWSCKGR